MIGDAIRAARLRAKLSQEELAARARVTREYVSLVERGVHSPTVEKLEAFAKALETQGWQLLKAAEK